MSESGSDNEQRAERKRAPRPPRPIHQRRSFTHRLILTALLVAISVILTRYVSIMMPDGSSRIGIGPVPITMAGLLLGPAWGAAAGLVADVVGYLLNSFGGPFHPGFTLVSVLEGLIPGAISWAFIYRRARRGEPFTIWSDLTLRIIIAQIFNTAVGSILLTSLWISQLAGMPYMAALVLRLPVSLVTGGLRLAVLLVLMPALRATIGTRLDRQFNPRIASS